MATEVKLSKKDEELYEQYAGALPVCVCAQKKKKHRPIRPSCSMCFRFRRSHLLFPSSDLYAIVKTTEKLERAYVRDAISAADYEPACEKLIGQFRTLWETLRDTVRGRGREREWTAGAPCRAWAA
jgi:hypothetical protein